VFQSANAGAVTVTVNDYLVGPNASNYILAEPTVVGTITPRPLTVTAVATPYKIFNGGTATNVTLYSNPVAGDSIALNYSSANYLTPNTGYGKTIQVSGVNIIGGNPNYIVADPILTTTGNIILLNGAIAPPFPIAVTVPNIALTTPPPSPLHIMMSGTVDIVPVDCPDDGSSDGEDCNAGS